MKTWLAILAPLLLCACGGRTELTELTAPTAPTAPPVPQRPQLPASYCQGTDTSVYVVTEQAVLYRFDPPSGVFTSIGTISCPGGGKPDSMAVDYKGTAYVNDGNGQMFEVSTATAACTATTYVVSPSFGSRFGMGFSTNLDGKGETLFLAAEGAPGQLGTLDTSTFAVQVVGDFSVYIGATELTGDGDGKLFGFGNGAYDGAAHLAEIDKTDATIVKNTVVPTPTPTQLASWAFASWGGDFYFFTSGSAGDSTVGRLSPSDGSFDPSYATLPGEAISGAGVSTCAPR